MSAASSPPGFEYPPNGHNPVQDQDWDWSAAFPTEPLEPAIDAPNFFDNLLNPTIAHDPAFAYANASPYDMSSSRAQPGRLSNGYVDLTSPHVDLTTQDSPPPRRKRDSPSPGPSSKRRKREDGTAAEGPSNRSPAQKIEEIDLSQDDDKVLEVLQKQREEAVKAQARPEETVTTFNTLTCVICMDKPTDLTATACGHLFCHTCLMEALIAGEQRGNPGEQRKSQCPVCRKTVSRNKANDIIPLLLKKGLATQPRRKPGTIPTAAAPTKVQ